MNRAPFYSRYVGAMYAAMRGMGAGSWGSSGWCHSRILGVARALGGGCATDSAAIDFLPNSRSHGTVSVRIVGDTSGSWIAIGDGQVNFILVLLRGRNSLCSSCLA